jgi:hypothetical protein
VAARTVEQVRPTAMSVIPDHETHFFPWGIPIAAVLGLAALLWYLAPSSPPSTTAIPPAPVATTAAVPAAPPAPAAQPWLWLTDDNGTFSYSGQVRDEATKTSIINALSTQYGADKIKGVITVDPNVAPAPWVTNLGAALDNLKVNGLQALFSGNSVNVGGLASDTDRDRLVGTLRSLLGGGLVFGSLADKLGDLVSGATGSASHALAALKSNYGAADVVSALNLAIINFPLASAEIPTASGALLKEAAAKIRLLPAGRVIEISGHTDSTGDPAANVSSAHFLPCCATPSRLPAKVLSCFNLTAHQRSPSRKTRWRPLVGSGPGRLDRPSSGIDPLDLSLLTAELFVHGFHVLGADLLERDFLDNPRGLAHQRMLGGLDDLDRAIRPIQFADEVRVGDGATQHLRMLFVQSNICRNVTLSREAAHSCPARLNHLFTDLQLFFGEAQHLVMGLRDLWRDGDILRYSDRRRSNSLGSCLHLGGRCDAGGDGAIMHIDRPMQIENASGVRDLAVQHAQRDHGAAARDRVVVHLRLVLVKVAAKQAIPQARLFCTGAGGDAAFVEDADVVFVEATGLQCLHGRLGMLTSVERRNRCLVRHHPLLSWLARSTLILWLAVLLILWFLDQSCFGISS